MEVCGEAENRLASELMQHELQMEKDVLDPLSQLAEVRPHSGGQCVHGLLPELKIMKVNPDETRTSVIMSNCCLSGMSIFGPVNQHLGFCLSFSKYLPLKSK